jgi:enolase-phosphatase E1
VIGTIVLDIEGTTSSSEFVSTTLFAYSRTQFSGYLAAHADETRVKQIVEDVRAAIDEPKADDARIVEVLQRWVDMDAKITPLKTLQGWIWEDGFARGALVSHFYPDVIPALREWHRGGYELVVFSSGSVAAQRAWFGHSPAGDLTPLQSGDFDTETAGPKREARSYGRIASALDVAADAFVFLSDTTAELDAARASGWNTVGVRRPGEPSFANGVGDHAQISSFAQLDPSGIG